MSATGSADLWARLQSAGLVTGAAPPPDAAPAPWYVRAMVGIAGWIAASFFFGFIGAAFHFVLRNGDASIVTGLVLCAAAVAMLRTLARREFFAQFALAVSFAGQALVVAGLFQLYRSHEAGVYVAIAALEVVLAAVAPNPVHRTWSAFAAAIAVFFALHEWHAAFLFPGALAAAFVLVHGNDARLARTSAICQPVASGLALALVALVPLTMIVGFTFPMASSGRPSAPRGEWAGPLLLAAVFVASTAWLVVKNGFGLMSRVGVVALITSVLLAIAGMKVPALLAGFLVVMFAFASGHLAMTGLGIVAVISSLSYYYYSLDATLLEKSISLVAAGVILLAARSAMRLAFAGKAEEDRHA